ncbi:MAG: protein-L-isoaspartate(D-aspartate) O-methyltransferase [Desulfobacteraceae bacterium]|nr:protein-L-isoaspartate(D-aspartate) O-methyltransferase [Desulfobacteraceae bacterium]
MCKKMMLITWAGLLLFVSAVHGFENKRREMVTRQIAGRDISDKATLDTMRSVPRHLFVPDSQQAYAYHDRPLPIGYGQTISQPYIVGYMTQIIGPKKGQRVLEIGTGSGYQAAVLAQIVDLVFSIEIIAPLADQARKIIEQLSYDNVRIKHGDGYYGWEEHAPFDAIVVTAAAEYIPPPLLAQLKPGGKMVIPVGSPFMTQQLMLVTKKGDDIITRALFPVRFVPFTRSDKQ